MLGAAHLCELAALAVLAVLIGLAGLALVAEAQDARLVVVGGSSMQPAMPIGSLAFERAPGPADPLSGAVVTARLPSGVLVTHRVTREVTLDGIAYVETRGDANRAADPVLTPRSDIVGRVTASVPYLGYLQVALSRPGGWLTMLAVLASLWLAGELLREVAPAPRLREVTVVSGA